MKPQRPPAIYCVLFSLALLAWGLPDLFNAGAWSGGLSTEQLSWEQVSALFKVIFALLALALVLLSYISPIRPWQPDWQIIVCLGLGLNTLFFVLYNSIYYIYNSSFLEVQLSIYSLKHVIPFQLTLIVLIVLQWHSQQSQAFNWLVFSLGFLLLSSGIMFPLTPLKGVYIWLVLSFVIVISLSSAWPQLRLSRQANPQAQRQYILNLLLVLGLSSLLGLTGLHAFEVTDRSLTAFLSQIFMQQTEDQSGLSDQTHLKGNHRLTLSEKIALRIRSPRALSYWRGNILSFYHEGHWLPEETLLQAISEQASPSAAQQDGLRAYSLHPQQRETELTLQVESLNHYQGMFFLPAEAQVLLAPQDARIYQDQYGLLRRDLFQSSHHYALQTGKEKHLPASFDTETLRKNLQIDPDIAAALRPLAEAITATGQTDREKAHLLENWFQQNFTYSLQTEAVTPGLDPTVDFVLNRKPAWCSWFASGMVLMLRSLEVPAHLVSGWRDMEYNPLSQHWVIREKSAHAWVEMLDDANQTWVRFDPTPAEQLDVLQRPATPIWLRQTYEALQVYLQQGSKLLQILNPQAAWHWLQVHSSHLTYLLMLALLILLLKSIYDSRKRVSTEPALGQPLDYQGADQVVERTLSQLQHWLTGRDLPPIHEISDWLQAHQTQLNSSEHKALQALWQELEAQRFGPPDAERVQRLAALLQALLTAVNQRPSA